MTFFAVLRTGDEVAQRHKLKPVSTVCDTYMLPIGPDGKNPIIFVPGNILRPLPVAQSWDEIGDVVRFNQALRYRLNGIINRYWKKGMKALKKNLRETFFSNPRDLKDLLAGYKKYEVMPYDALSDPHGMLKWFELGEDYSLETIQYLLASVRHLRWAKSRVLYGK